LSGVHGGDNSQHDFLDVAPSVSTQNHDRYFATFQVLLIDEVLIGREQKVEPSLLGYPKQFAVGLKCPSPVPLRF
jgi:hypothetical protein